MNVGLEIDVRPIQSEGLADIVSQISHASRVDGGEEGAYADVHPHVQATLSSPDVSPVDVRGRGGCCASPAQGRDGNTSGTNGESLDEAGGATGITREKIDARVRLFLQEPIMRARFSELRLG